MTEGNCVGITNFILSKLSIGFLKFQKIKKIESLYCFSKINFELFKARNIL